MMGLSTHSGRPRIRCRGTPSPCSAFEHTLRGQLLISYLVDPASVSHMLVSEIKHACLTVNKSHETAKWGGRRVGVRVRRAAPAAPCRPQRVPQPRLARHPETPASADGPLCSSRLPVPHTRLRLRFPETPPSALPHDLGPGVRVRSPRRQALRLTLSLGSPRAARLH